MPGSERLELLCKHIPDRYEHLVRYVGWSSNRARGERAKKACLPTGVALLSPAEAPATEFAARAKATWMRLIRKVYEAYALECPKCKGPMGVIALIDDPPVIRRVLEHLDLWTPEASGPGPPMPAGEWPSNAVIPLTYQPVPDIALFRRLARNGILRPRRSRHCTLANSACTIRECTPLPAADRAAIAATGKAQKTGGIDFPIRLTRIIPSTPRYTEEVNK